MQVAKDVLVFLIDRTHQCCGRRQHLIDEDEDRLLWRKLNSLPDHIYELPNGQILRGIVSIYLPENWDQLSLLTDGTRYFFLSIVGISVRSAFSQITFKRVSTEP